MTDLEITKLCAEAMGWRPAGERKDFDTVKAIPVEQFPGAPHYQYAPLHDAASAMALVKKFDLCVWGTEQHNWRVMGHWREQNGALHEPDATGTDLNRAICECVAKMEVAK